MLFYIILGSVLAAFFWINRQGKSLKPIVNKTPRIIRVVGICLVLVLSWGIMKSTSQSRQKYHNDYKGGHLLEVPARIVDPSRWHELDVNKGGENYSYKSNYDMHLFIIPMWNHYTSFTLESSQSFEQILREAWIKEPVRSFGLNCNFDKSNDFRQKGKRTDLIFPYFYQSGSNGVNVDVKKLKKLTKNYEYSSNNSPQQGQSTNMYIGNQSEPFIVIPYKSSEKMVKIGINKLLGLVAPFRKNGLKSQFAEQSEEDVKLLTSCQLLSRFPINFYSFKSALWIIVILGAYLAICMVDKKLAIIIALLVSVIFSNFRDVSCANNPTYVLQNRYALPKSRSVIKTQLSTTNPMLYEYDKLRWYLQRAKISQVIKPRDIMIDTFSSPFVTMKFKDEGSFVNVICIGDQVRYRRVSSHGGGSSGSMHSNLQMQILDLVTKYRRENSLATNFIFDFRSFRIKELREEPIENESYQGFLTEKFSEFFTETGKAEIEYLEMNNAE